MSPEKVLELLQIVDLSSKSAGYAHITNSAHTALINAQLVVLPATPEHHSSPPPSAPARPTMADTRR
jgi:hypothetical protein